MSSQSLVFSRNELGESKVLDFGMSDSEKLWVMCEIQLGWKTYAITRITYNNHIFYHENMVVYYIGDEPEELFASIIKKA